MWQINDSIIIIIKNVRHFIDNNFLCSVPFDKIKPKCVSCPCSMFVRCSMRCHRVFIVYGRIKRHPRRLSKRKEVKLMLNDAYLLCLMCDGCCVKSGKKVIIKINSLNRSGCFTIGGYRPSLCSSAGIEKWFVSLILLKKMWLLWSVWNPYKLRGHVITPYISLNCRRKLKIKGIVYFIHSRIIAKDFYLKQWS